MHPTVKPVALVADAIKDCSKRGEVVLGPFAGSGTTLIAAEKTGRRARVIEFDPIFTGKKARLAENGRSFDEIADERLGAASTPNELDEAA